MEIINEELARQGWNMGHMSDYKPGSATEEYRSYVNEAEKLAEECKKKTDPMYHAKIDRLLEVYREKIAECINARNKIDTMCPSVLVSGAGNFPVRKKQRQIAAWERNDEAFKEAEKLLDKMRSTGHGGISADDPDAVEKLKKKLAEREEMQEKMKYANVVARRMAERRLLNCSIRKEEKPYPAYALSNNNAEIRRLKKRIEELENRPHFEGWEFSGGAVEVDEADNRVRIRHDEKPAQEIIDALKSNGFRWSPFHKAWQRQLTRDAMRAAKKLFGGEAA